MAIIFRKLKQYISRVARISVCQESEGAAVVSEKPDRKTEPECIGYEIRKTLWELRQGKAIDDALWKSMYTRPFWHYCEVCGKKEFITAREAADQGWQYPPDLQHQFGKIGPRVCGSCRTEDTLFWKVMFQMDGVQKFHLDMKDVLTPEELVTWERIKGEPESLLED